MKKRDLKLLFMTSRPVSWVNTAYPFAAAYLVTTKVIDPLFLLGTFFFLIPYNLLMYGVNDVFDYESDMRNPRKGSIEGAVLSKHLHKPVLLLSTLVTIIFAAPLFLQGTAMANAVLVYLLFMVVAYSAPGLRFKERPILDSFTSATHFVGPMVYGFVLAGFWSESATVISIAFFLWAMASHAFGAVQDITADREAKIASIATVFGARLTVRLAFLSYIISSLLVFCLGNPGAWITSLAGLLYAANIYPYLHITDTSCETANQGWKHFMLLNFIAGAVITVVLVWQFLY